MINIVIFLTGAISLVLWLIFTKGPQRLSVSVALGLFILSLFGGVWITYNPALSWPALLYLVSNIALCFIIAFAPLSPRWIAKGIVILGSLLAFYFVAQYAHFDYQGEVAGSWARLGELTGSWLPAFVPFKLHPNLIAGLLEGILILSLGFIGTARGYRRWLLGAIVLLLAYALLITGSRGAWLGVATALSLGAILLLPQPARLPAGVGLGLTVGSLLSLTMTSQADLLNSAGTAAGSLSGFIPSRMVLYRNVLHLLSDYPFTGIGLGDTFANVYSRYQILIEVLFVRQPHNLFLAIWLGQGLVGIIAAVWLLIEFYRFVIRVERRGAVHRSIFLFRGAWLGATAIFIHGLVDNVSTLPTQFIMLGLTLALGRPLLARFEQERPRPRWNTIEKKVTGGLLAIILIAAVLFFQQALIGAWYANLGAIQQTQADLSPTLNELARQERLTQAKYYFERALAAEPIQPTANRRLGMIALEQYHFESALAHLEQAYPYEPYNQATLKLLGYAYLWNGQLDLAEERFRQVERRDEVIQELTHYWWWWGTQQRADLSEYANQVRQRLLSTESYSISERSQNVE